MIRRYVIARGDYLCRRARKTGEVESPIPLYRVPFTLGLVWWAWDRRDTQPVETRGGYSPKNAPPSPTVPPPKPKDVGR